LWDKILLTGDIGNSTVRRAVLHLTAPYVWAVEFVAVVGLHFVVLTYWVEFKVRQNYVRK
jgi:hypothetical protein